MRIITHNLFLIECRKIKPPNGMQVIYEATWNDLKAIFVCHGKSMLPLYGEVQLYCSESRWTGGSVPSRCSKFFHPLSSRYHVWLVQPVYPGCGVNFFCLSINLEHNGHGFVH